MKSPQQSANIPGLPQPPEGMNWRSLNQFKKTSRGEAFYLTCLQYAQQLWSEHLPARAILCLDRAWAADLHGNEPVLAQYPLPYLPLLYIIEHAPSDTFIGNPRVHFQHYADRLGEPRREQRKWRSWACWAIACQARPNLPADPKHDVIEPTLDEIANQLKSHGHPNEVELWRSALPRTP